MTLFVVSICVATIVSFLCSLMEATLLSLTPSQLAELSQRKPGAGKTWRRFKAHVEKPMAVILIVNTAANTIGASVAGAQFGRIFGSTWVWVFSLAFTWLILQFSEILPKTLAVRFNKEVAGRAARPLSFMVWLLTPLQRAVHWINRPFEIRRAGREQPATVEEIAALAGLARLTEQISTHQERIIKGASRLSRVTARGVMIPVQQVSFLSTSQTLPEALIAAHLDAHTRFPVCDNNDVNKVVGYVNFKELIYFMRMNPNDPSLRGVIRPVHSATADSSAADLLEVFVSEHIHMAIVRDEEGKTLGLVTLEDIVRQLVGRVEDEFDKLPVMIHELSGKMWMVGGGVTVGEVAKHLGLALPVSQETMSAWLIGHLGHPKPGDAYHEAGAEFVVRRMRRAKVFEVSISTAPEKK